MTVTYVFQNLKSAADHIDMRAQQARENAQRFKPKSLKYTAYISEAAAFESVASMLRDTQLRTDEDVVTTE